MSSMPSPLLLASPFGGTYDFIPIAGALLILYLASWYLSQRGIVLTQANHKKVWNVCLLTSFLVAGILGLLMVIRINYGVSIPLPFNMLFVHVEFGIALATIAIFHVLWHLSYFKAYLKR